MGKEQHTAKSSLLGGSFSLIPPNSEDFWVYGEPDTVKRAREWALRQEYLLYDGPAAHCVHGLYRMDACTFRACTSVGLDHTRIWVQADARGAFLLTHPYATKIPEAIHTYGQMHGLDVETYEYDRWYHSAALPIRLTIPADWPIWPIEQEAALLLHTQPIDWPDAD